MAISRLKKAFQPGSHLKQLELHPSKKNTTWSKDGKVFTALTQLFTDSEGKTLFHLITDSYVIEDGKRVLFRKDENRENG